MSRILIFIVLIALVACNSSSKFEMPEGANWRSDDFFVQGEVVYSMHYFCSIAPEYVSYAYRTGKWKFWNHSGRLIAEGEYHPEKKVIENHGGCSYEKIVSDIDKKQWQFWDDKGNKIDPDEEHIEKLDYCRLMY